MRTGGYLVPASHRCTFLIRSLRSDATTGTTGSTAESWKLATTIPKAGAATAGVRGRKSPAKAGGSLRHRQSAETKLAELKHRLREIGDLNAAGALLGWDHATYMPQCGAGARARQSATLSKLAHEKSVDPQLGKLLDALEPHAGVGLAGLDPGCCQFTALRD